MRFAIDCRYVRERPSGIGAYVEALVARLPPRAPDAQFVLWTHPQARHPLSCAPNVTEAVVRAEPNSLWSLLWPERYGPIDADLFHAAHTVLPRGLTIPTVVTIHDLLALELPRLHRSGLDGLIKRLYYPRFVWRALTHATRLITTTAAMADRVAQFCPEARRRTVVIPLAPAAVFRSSSDPGASSGEVHRLLGSDDPYFVVVGQNSATKRHTDAMHAFAAAAPRPWRLVLLQRQSRSNPLASLTRRLKIADRVIWLPTIAQGDLVTVLQGAGALLQPSRYEGFGLPVVEAMACACPVVVSDLPTLREVVGGAGVCVAPGDITALAEAIRRVAGSASFRQELSARALERANGFSWDRCAGDTLAVYAAAARDRAQPGIR